MLKEKGYFMIDGVKSTDLPHEDKSGRKQKAKSGDDSKIAKKRSSGASVGKSKTAGKKVAEKTAASGKKGASKKSDDDLDIEESEALEASD